MTLTGEPIDAVLLRNGLPVIHTFHIIMAALGNGSGASVRKDDTHTAAAYLPALRKVIEDARFCIYLRVLPLFFCLEVDVRHVL